MWEEGKRKGIKMGGRFIVKKKKKKGEKGIKGKEELFRSMVTAERTEWNRKIY